MLNIIIDLYKGTIGIRGRGTNICLTKKPLFWVIMNYLVDVSYEGLNFGGVGVLFYADDIAMLSPTAMGL